VKKNQRLSRHGTSYSVPIITEPGKDRFPRHDPGITIQSEIDKETGTKGLVVIEHKEDLHPQIVIVDPKTKEVLAATPSQLALTFL
jgi:DNA-directed RNA polymerase subunit beta'